MSLQKKKNEKTSKQNVQRATFSKVNFSAIVFMLIEAVVEKNLLSHRGIPGGSRGSQIPGGSKGLLKIPGGSWGFLEPLWSSGSSGGFMDDMDRRFLRTPSDPPLASPYSRRTTIGDIGHGIIRI